MVEPIPFSSPVDVGGDQAELERPVAAVPEQARAPEVADHDEVRPSVVVEVREGAGPGVGGAHRLAVPAALREGERPRRARDVLEVARLRRAAVAEQARVRPDARAGEPLVHVEVRVTVAIEVPDRHALADVERAVLEGGAARDGVLREDARAVVEEEVVAPVERVAFEPDRGHVEVEIAVVLHVDEGGAVAVEGEGREARGLRDVREGAVPAVAVEDVRPL
ncbi:MAG: hypothetical protein M5U28_29265 [Sandaracinaceae bacterium]|nr:hypothetical protein [Sandaracinaceae bacterium]